jgi:cellulose synthase/poly-beta-1,6-N-acetylglucosamine synthase-like glycosyltransferase
MISITSYLLTTVAGCLAVPTVIFVVEVCAAFFWRPLIEPTAKRLGTIAVLIPAHDEAQGILTTLSDITPQLRPTDRLLVVADNCTDDTASIAASAGAEVVVRSDLSKIGKGYALDLGLSFLASNPPDIVVMIDADCRSSAGLIEQLASMCEQTQRPVQSLYLMVGAEETKINHQVAEFAWRIKNWVRPLGLQALGLPCQLMGSGMAFPWKIIRSVDLSSGSIVEDLKLGLELAAAGYAPLFCPSAVVKSDFPNFTEGAMGQRKRWEHGQIGLIRTTSLPHLFQAIRLWDVNLAALVLDLLVPPLSLLVIVISTFTVGTGITVLVGLTSTAFVISVSCLVAIDLAVILAWVMRGRDVLPPKSLALLPSYLVMKCRLYIAAALGERVSQWARADRTKVT